MTARDTRPDLKPDKTFTADTRARIGKQAGDTVTVTLDERIAR